MVAMETEGFDLALKHMSEHYKAEVQYGSACLLRTLALSDKQFVLRIVKSALPQVIALKDKQPKFQVHIVFESIFYRFGKVSQIPMAYIKVKISIPPKYQR